VIQAYDIRGLFPETLTSRYIKIVAKAISRSTIEKAVYIGYDGRASSIEIRNILQEIFLSEGVQVIDLGLIPTPLSYYAVYAMSGAKSGVMVTGSHNPPEYNGLKIILNGQCLDGKDIANIIDILKQDLPNDGVSSHDISRQSLEEDVIPQYVALLERKFFSGKNLSLIALDRLAKLKVLWDPGNGAVCAVLPELLSKIPCQHVLINEEIDPAFSARAPDIRPKDLAGTIKALNLYKCNICFAFDGDGDRLCIITRDGRILRGDEVLFVFVYNLLQRKATPTILLDIKASEGIVRSIRALGGIPLLSECGHSIIKKRLAIHKEIDIAGEVSGHIFFNEHYSMDDALFGACKMLCIYADDTNIFDRSLSQIPKRVCIDDIKIGCTAEEKVMFMDCFRKHLIRGLYANNEEGAIKIVEKFKDQFGEGVIGEGSPDLSVISVYMMDGIRYCSGDGCYVIRYSNTENYVAILMESEDPKGLEKICKDLYPIITNVANELSITNISSQVYSLFLDICNQYGFNI